MFASRTAARSAQAVRVRGAHRAIRNTRFQSTNPPRDADRAGGLHPAAVGGIAGAAVSLAGFYAWYHFSGAKTIVQKTSQIKFYFDDAQKKLKENIAEKAPEPNEALNWLRQSASFYGAFIPGAKQYIDSAFDDLDTIREKHGDEVDNIVKEAFNELKDVSQQGLSAKTAQQAWDILQKHMTRIGELAGDAASEILNNHPQLKEKVGGNLDQLKKLGDQYGPEAKRQVEETWDQIRDIMKSGVSAETATKIKNLVQEKSEMIKRMGDEAWKKGMEQAKPYLDKNPKVKELVEKNADALKRGNVQELWQTVKQSVETGDTSKIEQYVKQATDKAKQSGFGGLDQIMGRFGGGEIIPKLQQLQQVAQKHGQEAEKLFKEAMDEIQQVLSKKSDQAKALADKAKKDSK